MNFRPLGSWLTIKFRPPATRTKSGLYLGAPIYSQIATVHQIGDAVTTVKPGDVVMMQKYGDGMTTQTGLWFHYYNHLAKFGSDAEFDVTPIVVTDDDIFGKWDDKLGLIPIKNNVVMIEEETPEVVNNIIRVFRKRQNRLSYGKITKVSENVTEFSVDQTVLLGKYGGVYFTDIDDKEKVMVSKSEILGTILDELKAELIVGETREAYDPKIGSKLYSK